MYPNFDKVRFLNVFPKHVCITVTVESEDDESMLEGHLVVHIHDKLKGDKQCLQLNKVKL